MGILNGLFKKKAPTKMLYSPSGEPVSRPPEDYVLASSETVFSAISLLSNAIASAPISLRKNYDAVDPSKHKVAELCKFGFNPNFTSFEFIRCLEASRLSTGAAYALIVRDQFGRPSELYPIISSYVSPRILPETGDLYYDIFDPVFKTTSSFHKSDIIAVNYVSTSVTGAGINPIEVLRNTLNYSKSIQDYSINQLKRGLKPNIVIMVEGQPDAKTYDEYDKVVQRFKENGVLYISPDQQVTDLKDSCVIDPKVAEIEQITVKKVASVFNIPSYKIWDGSSSYSSAEEADLEYLKDTILPTIRLYEQEFSKSLLTREERLQGYEIKLSMNGFARGNMNTRAEFYQKMIRNGSISPNEIREIEDMPPYPGGDEFYLSRDMISVADLKALNQKELNGGYSDE